MGNHVIRDRLWDSGRIKRCSRDAALAYPWIFLVADDWGRFEFDAHRIWTKVFGNRKDVSEAEVVTWLAEYEREGLLFRYHLDGGLAVWYNFKGMPPSQRRKSEFPDPAEFIDPKKYLGRNYVQQERTSTGLVPDRTGSGRKRAAEQTVTLTPDQIREPIEAYNATFGARVTDTPGNLRASVRAFEAGYTVEQMRTVFEAVRARKTPTAVWCADNNREFEYLIRPAYKHNRTQELVQGPLDKIPNELATGRRSA